MSRESGFAASAKSLFAIAKYAPVMTALLSVTEGRGAFINDGALGQLNR
jgi:hypothetical protein